LDDKHYIKRVLHGEKNAFRHLVGKYQKLAYTVAFRILRHNENTEEAVQDAFLKAYQSLDKFRLGAKFSTWFYRIVYNSAIDIKRKIKPNTSSIDEEFEFNAPTPNNLIAEFEFGRTDEQKYIKQALNKLSEIDSLLIILYHLNELSIGEIAAITDLSKSNIKTKLMRSRQEMRRYLEHTLKKEIEVLI
jgi:RNA polymerase sigma-70 factor, ECF subfamily